MLNTHFYKPIQKYAYRYVDDSNIQENNDQENYNDDNISNNSDYINNQSQLLNSQNQQLLGRIPQHIDVHPNENVVNSLVNNSKSTHKTNENSLKTPTDPYHTFDPYFEHLRKTGAFIQNSRSKINSKTYSINSKARSKHPQIVTENRLSLPTDALMFDTITENIGITTTTRDILTVNCPNHNVKKGEHITLSGLTPQSLSIKSIYNDINGDQKDAIIFTNYSTSVIIKCNYDTVVKDPNTGLPTSKIDKTMSFDPSFKLGSNINYTDLKNYDTSDMFVTLSGFDISVTGLPFVGNIPINFLNSTHRVYFTNPDFKIINGEKKYTADTIINIPDSNGKISKITGFYILLQIPFLSPNTKEITSTGNLLTNTITPMIINIQFNYVGGIPLNLINAHYPIDKNNIKGSHEVYSVSDDTINILVNKTTYYKNSQQNIPFGGSELEISTIKNVTKGYGSPNNYSIELPNSINNIVMARLTSITIPNTAKVFTNALENQNNKIYWQNQDDGDFIYSVEIDPGNYSPTDLQTALQNKIYSVPRKYAKNITKETSYTDRTFMAISIDVITNIVTFSGFKEAVLRKPIQDITPPIPTVGDGEGLYQLTISQNNHGLLVGDSVTFAGFVATNGIPAGILNAIHIVKSVPNDNTYTIEIANFNLLTGSRIDTGGGFSARVLVPSAFKLLFNYSDTVGNELGFRNVGQEYSITPFKTTISNYEPYENEVVVKDTDGNSYISDSSGNIFPLTANSLKLDGHDYILMVIKNFNNIINVSDNKKITSYFAKINLRGLPGTVIYDDFICPPLVFNEPVNISSLNIAFYTPDGALYDFDGLDHNFTIEFTTIEYVPEGTGIVSTLSMF